MIDDHGATGTATGRLIVFLAGLLGATGVALAAAATHTGATHMLGNASAMCLAHAPALLALAVAGKRLRTAHIAALVLGIGTALFAADLVSRHFLESRLFAFAAPVGGAMMMIGWITVAAGALVARKP